MSGTLRNKKTKHGWNKNYTSPKFKSSHSSETTSKKLEIRNSNRSIKKKKRLTIKAELRELIKNNARAEV